MSQLSLPSPLGPLTVTEEDGAIVSLDWGEAPDSVETPLLLLARAQLGAYFAGRLTTFSLPLRMAGTAFQRRVWQAMCTIPYGGTRSYAEMARNLGSGPRAVGGACGRNPVPIIVPCHRVVAAGGRLGGYSGWDGVEAKRWLLDLESGVDP